MSAEPPSPIELTLQLIRELKPEHRLVIPRHIIGVCACTAIADQLSGVEAVHTTTETTFIKIP